MICNISTQRGICTLQGKPHQFLSCIWLPREDPRELVAEGEDLDAGVDDGVGLVVRLQDPVVAEALLAGRTATLLQIE